MVSRALYYPEWNISDPAFLAECLLFWDDLACMVPEEGFREEPWNEDEEVRRLLAEANERFVFGFVPNASQKEMAHESIAAFAQHDPPDWCRPENLRPQQRQVFSAYKLAPQTVELLRDKGWARQLPDTGRPDLQLIADAAADLVLGALAKACSSDTLPTITDDPGSFTASCNHLLQDLGAPTGITANGQHRQQLELTDELDCMFLMTSVPRLGFEPGSFDPKILRRILDSRDDADIDGYRRGFQAKVQKFIAQLHDVEGPERYMVRRDFRAQLESDLQLLRTELRRARIDTVISKEGMVAILVGAVGGIALQPALGLAIGLAGGVTAYRQKRRQALEKHWSSWIMSITAPSFALW